LWPDGGGPDHVHDDARAPFGHRWKHHSAQVDVAEDLEFPGFPPAILADGGDVAGRNGAGVVDPNVDVASSCDKCLLFGTVRQVEGVNRN
jgi:hypothetical protein